VTTKYTNAYNVRPNVEIVRTLLTPAPSVPHQDLMHQNALAQMELSMMDSSVPIVTINVLLATIDKSVSLVPKEDYPHQTVHAQVDTMTLELPSVPNVNPLVRPVLDITNVPLASTLPKELDLTVPAQMDTLMLKMELLVKKESLKRKKT
jgi:hypothetical protein